MADTMIDTVPTLAEINGDFSQSGINIYNPFSSHPNPGFDPTKPVGPSNPQVIRDQFQDNGVNNVIPANLINPVAQEFLMNMCRMPNADMMMDMGTMPCGSAMMGAPTVVGAGTGLQQLRGRQKRTSRQRSRYDSRGPHFEREIALTAATR